MDVKINPEKKEELKKTTPRDHRLWIVSYIILAIISVTVYFLLQFRVFGLLGTYRSLLQRLAVAGVIISDIFIITRTIEQVVARRSQTNKVSYNIIRLIRLLSVVIAGLVVITFYLHSGTRPPFRSVFFHWFLVLLYKHLSPHSLAGSISSSAHLTG